MFSLSVILFFAINYNSCLLSVNGDCGGETDAVLSSGSLGNWSISLNESSGYCYVNECTIRIKESNVLLNIINKTADWIAATDSTNLFTIPVISNDSVIDCSEEDDKDLTLFVFYTVATFIICCLCSLNITLHLAVKKLRSTPGLLIIGICVTIIVVHPCIVTIAVFQYLHRVNGNTAICGVLKFMIVSFIVLYTLLKATYLFHFAYLMYRTYVSRPYQETSKRLLYIYCAINVIVTLVSSALMITLDRLEFPNAFETHNGYCTSYFFNDVGTSDYLYSNYIPVIILFAVLTAVGIIFFIVGLILYFLTTKDCCACSGTTNIRVSITLTSATALGALILVVLLFAGVDEEVTVMAASIGVCIEQVILLVVFLTSTKARDKLKKCFRRKKTVSRNTHTARISPQERYTASYIAMR